MCATRKSRDLRNEGGLALSQRSCCGSALPRSEVFSYQFDSNLRIEPRDELRQIVCVKTTAKRRAKSEAELLDHATGNLMRALKRDMLKKDGRIDYEKLRKEGYSERLLAKLEQA